MKFAEIIRGAGMHPSDLPKLSDLPVVLYDEKGREYEEETIDFNRPFFEDNPESKRRFLYYCLSWEVKLADQNYPESSKPSQFYVKLSDSMLVVWTELTKPHIFFRGECTLI